MFEKYGSLQGLNPRASQSENNFDADVMIYCNCIIDKTANCTKSGQFSKNGILAHKKDILDVEMSRGKSTRG